MHGCTGTYDSIIEWQILALVVLVLPVPVSTTIDTGTGTLAVRKNCGDRNCMVPCSAIERAFMSKQEEKVNILIRFRIFLSLQRP
eukprot:COSAG04_NODE_12273_length_661_cov_0.825623_1_plen_85_part_00